MSDDKMKDRKPRTKAEPRQLDEKEREIIGRADTEPGTLRAPREPRAHADGDDAEPRDRDTGESGNRGDAHPGDVHDERG